MLLQKLRAILRHHAYKVYTRPFELNIVGLRSSSTVPNRFDDEIHVFYKVNTLRWNYHIFKATTDPGTFWLRNPMQAQGTAILAQGQYENAYRMGLHQGKYLALVELKAVTIIRDYNRDAVLDFYNGKKTKGLFGINIHRANRTGNTKTVDKNSAGCQVFENAKDYEFFMQLCTKHKNLYGNSFTYTLIDFRAVKRENLRRMALGAGAASLMVLAHLAFRSNEKIKRFQTQLKESIQHLFKS